jgi:putative ABC transport system ATP-binding protein
LTAIENIQLPMTLSGRVGKKPRQLAVELLAMVGLSERMEHRLEELSGGEQQRVAVAIALANRPQLLLADEPTGELDTATAKTIYDLFRDLNRKLGLTIVIVSHDPGIAKHVDRVVAVRDGRLASETLRVKASADGDTHQSDKLHTFEELVILDSAGRLQLPREYLDHFHIKRRVRLEISEGGILIRPPKPEQVTSEHLSDSSDEVEAAEMAIDEHGGPAWLDRPGKLLNSIRARFHFRGPSQQKSSEENGNKGER